MEPQRFIEAERTATAQNTGNPWNWVEADVSAFSDTTLPQFRHGADTNTSAYYQDYMSWKPEISNQTGRLKMLPPETTNELDVDSQDRITLLSKKYASSSLNLEVEDSARLKILDERMSLNNPRYDESDLELIEKAQNLVKELFS